MLDNVMIGKLVEILDKEAAVYEDILKLSENKTGIIVKGNVAELESIVKLEQSLVVQLGRLENVREEMVGRISAALHTEPSKVTISQLTTFIGAEESGKLQKCQNRLESVLTELKGKNELNSKLIKSSLDYIDFSINVISSNAATGNNYGDSGSVAEGGKRRLFDVKL